MYCYMTYPNLQDGLSARLLVCLAAAKFKANLTSTQWLAQVGRAATGRDPCHGP